MPSRPAWFGCGKKSLAFGPWQGLSSWSPWKYRKSIPRRAVPVFDRAPQNLINTFSEYLWSAANPYPQIYTLEVATTLVARYPKERSRSRLEPVIPKPTAGAQVIQLSGCWIPSNHQALATLSWEVCTTISTREDCGISLRLQKASWAFLAEDKWLSVKTFFKTDPALATARGNPMQKPDSTRYFFQIRIEFTILITLPVPAKF